MGVQLKTEQQVTNRAGGNPARMWTQWTLMTVATREISPIKPKITETAGKCLTLCELTFGTWSRMNTMPITGIQISQPPFFFTRHLQIKGVQIYFSFKVLLCDCLYHWSFQNQHRLIRDVTADLSFEIVFQKYDFFKQVSFGFKPCISVPYGHQPIS